MTHPITRRDVLRLIGAASVAGHAPALVAAPRALLRRAIPASGETVPAVGLGSWQTFDLGSSATERAPLKAVLARFAALGGSVVDSSPMYGRSEAVIGDLAAELGLRPSLFLATKVWTSGRAAGLRQMEESLRRLRTERLDLMQVHNLLDTDTHLRTLRAWKEQGRVRYVGVTHYTESAYDELELVMGAERLDFVQINYSIAERAAEQRILPLAAERGIAVLVNRPFAKGGLFARVREKPLPPWAVEFDCASWAQFLLKFILSHPAVTCVIPATSKEKHLEDNMEAGFGRLPDAKTRGRMAAVIG